MLEPFNAHGKAIHAIFSKFCLLSRIRMVFAEADRLLAVSAPLRQTLADHIDPACRTGTRHRS